MKKVNSDVAYDFIRRKIINGEYPPGFPLLTETLSAEIKVSRTPVREALHKLKGEGLVNISPRLGASVMKMDVKDFRETCELRLALEGHASGLAALNHSQNDLREIKFALEAMRVLTDKILASEEESAFIDDLLREDVRFHLIKREILRLHLVNRIVIGPLAKTAERSKADMDENRRKVMASHEEIYEAIAAADSRAAKDAMERHIQDIIDKSLRAIAASGALTPRELTDEELAYSG
jgi:DNA-binding GntR family transcriptional regulator